MALQACGPEKVNSTPPPAVVAVEVRNDPPADLLVCPSSPAGFPAETATIPPAVRAAMIELAGAYAGVRDHLARLIAWHRPGACQDAGR